MKTNTNRKVIGPSPLERGAGVCLPYLAVKGWSGCCIFILLISILLTASIATASTSLTYEYDANGNLIRGDGKYYEYNDANQLIKVRHNDQSGPVLAEYFYDYTGQRLKKVENGVTTYYIGKHYEKQTSSTGSTTNSYYFANGERVAKKDSIGNISFYHSDHLGGTNVVTDSSGNLVERIKYYPFGEIREGGNERYSFTGKEKDKQTDFYYFEARYYNPEFNHFTQADSVAPNIYDPQDLNRYTYVRNNPEKFVDPTGHEKYYINPKKNEISEKPSGKMKDYLSELKKTNTGKDILSKIDDIAKNKDIYIGFSKINSFGLAGIKGLDDGREEIIPEGAYYVLLNSNFLNFFPYKKEEKLIVNYSDSEGTLTLAHEMQHVVDVEQALSSGYDIQTKSKQDKIGPAFEGHSRAIENQIAEEQKGFFQHLLETLSGN